MTIEEFVKGKISKLVLIIPDSNLDSSHSDSANRQRYFRPELRWDTARHVKGAANLLSFLTDQLRLHFMRLCCGVKHPFASFAEELKDNQTRQTRCPILWAKVSVFFNYSTSTSSVTYFLAGFSSQANIKIHSVMHEYTVVTINLIQIIYLIIKLKLHTHTHTSVSFFFICICAKQNINSRDYRNWVLQFEWNRSEEYFRENMADLAAWIIVGC